MSQSVARALSLLTLLQTGAQSLDECAEHLEVHKSTALRLLQTLEADGFVTHDERHRYRLGRALFALAGAALEQRDVRGAVRPHLERLNEATGQTVHLAALESGEAVYIDKLEARAGIRMYSRIGLTAPLHCTAVGKVLIAALPAAERERIAAHLAYPRMTASTITDPRDYLAELDRVRRAGWAHDRREHESFVECVAAPVRDATGAVVAAASVTVPIVVEDSPDAVALLPELLHAVRAASADLGWTAPDPSEGTP